MVYSLKVLESREIVSRFYPSNRNEETFVNVVINPRFKIELEIIIYRKCNSICKVSASWPLIMLIE